MKGSLKAIALSGLVLVIAPSAAQAGIIRSRVIEGDVRIQQAQESAYDNLVSNMPVVEGDVLWTGPSGRVELQGEGGSYIRLGQDTEVEFRNVAGSAGDSASDVTVLRLWSGSLYFDSSRGTYGEDQMEIETPASTIATLGRGVYRVDLDRGGETRVSVFDGAAEVSGRQGSAIVRSGERTYVVSGQAPEAPVRFSTFRTDSFDDWNRSLATAVYAEPQRNTNDLPDSLSSYYPELDRYGTWQYSNDYGRTVWVPQTTAGWRPYNDGQWYWQNGHPNWVSYEPWGWAPYHYGRWGFGVNLGWYWVPDVTWGPSWVSWFTGPDYWAWCPLDPWGYPTIVRNGWNHHGHGYWNDHHGWNDHQDHDDWNDHDGHYRKYCLEADSWTVVGHDDLLRKNVKKYAYRADRLDSLQPARKVDFEKIQVGSKDRGRLPQRAAELYRAPGGDDTTWLPTKTGNLRQGQKHVMEVPNGRPLIKEGTVVGPRDGIGTPREPGARTNNVDAPKRPAFGNGTIESDRGGREGNDSRGGNVTNNDRDGRGATAVKPRSPDDTGIDNRKQGDVERKNEAYQRNESIRSNDSDRNIKSRSFYDGNPESKRVVPTPANDRAVQGPTSGRTSGFPSTGNTQKQSDVNRNDRFDDVFPKTSPGSPTVTVPRSGGFERETERDFPTRANDRAVQGPTSGRTWGSPSTGNTQKQSDVERRDRFDDVFPKTSPNSPNVTAPRSGGFEPERDDRGIPSGDSRRTREMPRNERQIDSPRDYPTAPGYTARRSDVETDRGRSGYQGPSEPEALRDVVRRIIDSRVQTQPTQPTNTPSAGSGRQTTGPSGPVVTPTQNHGASSQNHDNANRSGSARQSYSPNRSDSSGERKATRR